MRPVHFLLTLLGVLAGLMAMHGLGPHDRDHSDGHALRLFAAALPDEATDEHSGPHHADDADRAAVSTQTAASVDSPDGDGGASAGECLALLGLLLWLLISAVLAARPRRPMLILRRVRERLQLRGRPPDPPCLTRLSILRC
jgi:hypothetical protein